MEDKKLNEIIVIDEKNNVMIVEEKLNALLLDITSFKSSLDELDKNVRSKLLDAMMKLGQTQIKLTDFTISLVLGSSKEVFDEDRFLEEENEETISPFIDFEVSKEFNLEKFKEENPELYEKYVIENEKYSVDSAKLSKLRPDIYHKYVTVIASTKKPTIAIKESKESKKK